MNQPRLPIDRERLAARAVTRRGFIRGSAAVGTAAVFAPSLLLKSARAAWVWSTTRGLVQTWRKYGSA